MHMNNTKLNNTRLNSQNVKLFIIKNTIIILHIVMSSVRCMLYCGFLQKFIEVKNKEEMKKDVM